MIPAHAPVPGRGPRVRFAHAGRPGRRDLGAGWWPWWRSPETLVCGVRGHVVPARQARQLPDPWADLVTTTTDGRRLGRCIRCGAWIDAPEDQAPAEALSPLREEDVPRRGRGPARGHRPPPDRRRTSRPLVLLRPGRPRPADAAAQPRRPAAAGAVPDQHAAWAGSPARGRRPAAAASCERLTACSTCAAAPSAARPGGGGLLRRRRHRSHRPLARTPVGRIPHRLGDRRVPPVRTRRAVAPRDGSPGGGLVCERGRPGLPGVAQTPLQGGRAAAAIRSSRRADRWVVTPWGWPGPAGSARRPTLGDAVVAGSMTGLRHTGHLPGVDVVIPPEPHARGSGQTARPRRRRRESAALAVPPGGGPASR